MGGTDGRGRIESDGQVLHFLPFAFPSLRPSQLTYNAGESPVQKLTFAPDCPLAR